MHQPLHVTLCQQEILRCSLSYDALKKKKKKNHRPDSGNALFFPSYRGYEA